MNYSCNICKTFILTLSWRRSLSYRNQSNDRRFLSYRDQSIPFIYSSNPWIGFYMIEITFSKKVKSWERNGQILKCFEFYIPFPANHWPENSTKYVDKARGTLVMDWTYFSQVLHFIWKTNRVFSRAKQVTGFYIECESGLKCVKSRCFSLNPTIRQEHNFLYKLHVDRKESSIWKLFLTLWYAFV